jgi:hypothetical protein
MASRAAMTPTLNIMAYCAMKPNRIPSGNSSMGETRRIKNVTHPRPVGASRDTWGPNKARTGPG